MPVKTCPECGAPLSAWNHSFGSTLCTDCVRVSSTQLKSFFEKTRPSEREIQEYPVSGFMGKMLGYAVILFAAMTISAIAGYGNAGSFGGLAYGFLGGMITVFVFRKFIVARSSVNPLDTRRWYHFAIVYSMLVVIFWTFTYMGFMPFNAYLGGSLFSFHVRITQNFHVAAFWLVTLIALVAGVIGGLIGYNNVVRSDRHDKAVTLIRYQQWKNAAA